MRPILTSGGAAGADLTFEEYALKLGHDVYACSFEGHNTSSKARVILSEAQLQQAEASVAKAGKALEKAVPRKPYIRNLIYRNYYQIRKCEQVIAVAPLTEDRVNVEGGTGWAVMMAKQQGLPVYVFDETKPKPQWWHYDNQTDQFQPIDGYPPLVQRYAGIGSRQLGPAGRAAIQSLYGHWQLTEAPAS